MSAIIASRELPSGNTETLIARQDSLPSEDDCDRSRPGDVCTIVSISSQKTEYGTLHPRDAADLLWEGCINGGCNVASMTIDTMYGSGTGVGPATIEVTAHGGWDPQLRHSFIFTMTELVGSSITTREVCEQGGAHNPGFCFLFHIAPQEFHIGRYRVGDQQNLLNEGDISLSMYQQDGDDTCEDSQTIFNSFAGLVPGGSVFGLLSLLNITL
ncbi:hypothetical protein B0I35DRAFT_406883 [Stachybotrys elegans]|uniref:Uncharacterized protein n=1 Tax=Stachybotrys elegans TaxID=80388 RepID=A0A8K0WTQ9_9HYPO|nr:hypothetical protein B0I35DRAFT_406883 [Stachybotrys elegans]